MTLNFKKNFTKTIILFCIFFSITISAFAFPRPKGQELNTICNIVSTDMLKKKIGDDEVISFPGVYNETKVDVQTDRINLGLDVVFGLGINEHDSYSTIDWISLNPIDWYIEFSPSKEVIAFLHDKIYLSGAYLPISDIYIPSTNSGSDVGGVLKPIDEIRFALGVDFPSYFGRDEWEPCLNIGLDYFNADFGGLGISVRNIATKERSIAISGTYTKIKNLILNAGFSDDKLEKVFHLGTSDNKEHFMIGNLIFASVDYSYSLFRLQAESIFSQNHSNNNAYDFYVGSKATFTLSENIDFFTEFKSSLDFDKEDSNSVYIIKPGFNINYYGTNQLTIAIQFYITHPDVYFNIPLYWKYSF